ncbi:MAG: FIST N-terminal domain-containing protein [Bacillota bacterium]
MKSINITYSGFDSLQKELSSIKDFDSVFLVQAFTSYCDRAYIQEMTNSIKTILPNARIIGVTTAGEIINGRAAEGTTVLSITSFEHTEIETAMFEIKGSGYFQSGVNVANTMLSADTKALILFSSGITSNCENILKGIESVNSEVVVAGGKAADSGRFERSYVFTEEDVSENGIVCAALRGSRLSVYTEYSFCWEPIGKLMTVTGVHNSEILSIDNQSVLSVYEKYLGKDVSESLPGSATQFPLIIRRGNMKIARVPIRKSHQGSLTIDGDIYKGDIVQFGYGNVDMIIQKSINIINGLKKLPIDSLFVYSCVARKLFLEDMAGIELAPLNEIAPSAGFYTYGEFYHSGNSNNFLNETTTILGLSEREETAAADMKAAQQDGSKEEMGAKSYNTVKVLTHLINTVTTELSEINHNLEQKNQELHKTLNQLNETQTYLMSSDKMASVGNLIYGISHELNTPLAAIKSNIDTEAILISKLSSQEADLGNSCRKLYAMNEINKKALERVLEIISGLQSFVSSDGSDIKQIDLNEELDNVLLLVNNKIKGRISVSRAYEKLPLVTCYAQQLDQAFLNILMNSIQSIEGAGEIDISTSHYNDRIRIAIQYKVKRQTDGVYNETSASEADMGSSMSMAITHKIIEKHQGSINILDCEDGGTKFVIDIPVSILYCCK